MKTPRDDQEPPIDRLADAAIEGEDGDEILALTAAATALALGAAGAIEPIPGPLLARLEADAERHFSGPSPVVIPLRRPSKGWKVAACAGWLAAAASWLAMATLAWPARRDEVRPAQAAPRGWTAALTASDHPLARDAGGEVAWDQGMQAGSLRLKGLAGVDPRKGVYQLWIFDSGRDPRYPIDGGTFTVSDAARTTVVPVRAKLPVGRPKLFAITLEPPGGVVVSDRQRIMLTASYP